MEARCVRAPFAYRHGADAKVFQGKALELGDCDDANPADEKAAEDAESAEQSSMPPPKKGKAVKEKTTSAGQSSKGPKPRGRPKKSAATPAEVDPVIPTRTSPPTNETPLLAALLPSDATTSASQAIAITNIAGLPSTIHELEKLLPQFNVKLSVDTVEEELEDQIAQMALNDAPDLPKYLQMNLDVLETHHKANKFDDNFKGLVQLEKRKIALKLYLSEYSKSSSVGAGHGEAETPADMASTFDEMEIDTLLAPSCESNIFAVVQARKD